MDKTIKMNPSGRPAVSAPQLTAEMLKLSANVTCECGGMIFLEKLFFKKISAILSQSGKEDLAPMPVLICDKCGKVPSVFDPQNILPNEIKAKKLIV